MRGEEEERGEEQRRREERAEEVRAEEERGESRGGERRGGERRGGERRGGERRGTTPVGKIFQTSRTMDMNMEQRGPSAGPPPSLISPLKAGGPGGHQSAPPSVNMYLPSGAPPHHRRTQMSPSGPGRRRTRSDL